MKHEKDIVNILTPQSKFRIILSKSDIGSKYAAKILISKKDRIVLYGMTKKEIFDRITEILEGLKGVINFIERSDTN